MWYSAQETDNELETQSVGMGIRGQERHKGKGRCSNRSLDKPEIKNESRVRGKDKKSYLKSVRGWGCCCRY